ncbi:MAG: class I SAM-dependent methyltransferase [Actinomycetota bacterium]
MEHTTDHQSGRDEWDERYRSEDQLWSGHVNGSLAVEANDLTVGRALDVGCGEGADAIWLAERGWTVTAVDISGVAIDRARAEAGRRGLDVTWIAGDFPGDVSGRFDLVSLHYPAFPIDTLDAVGSGLAAAVAPGGVLLLVGHAPPEDLETAHFDPADYVQPWDVEPLLTDGWTVEVSETRPRPGDHHHGSHHVDDVVIRARRS